VNPRGGDLGFHKIYCALLYCNTSICYIVFFNYIIRSNVGSILIKTSKTAKQNRFVSWFPCSESGADGHSKEHRLWAFCVSKAASGLAAVDAPAVSPLSGATSLRDAVASIPSELATDPECRSRLWKDCAFFFRHRAGVKSVWKIKPGVTFYFRQEQEYACSL